LDIPVKEGEVTELEKAAEKYTIIPFHPNDHDGVGSVYGHQHVRFVEKEALLAGAAWRKEQDRDLIERYRAALECVRDKAGPWLSASIGEESCDEYENDIRQSLDAVFEALENK
jgi:hypothetical protein